MDGPVHVPIPKTLRGLALLLSSLLFLASTARADTPPTSTSTSDLTTLQSGTTDAYQATAGRKANYGHYFATRYDDTPGDVAMLCSQPGVRGVLWRETWNEVEPSPGQYDFSGYERVLRAIETSNNPKCQLWVMVEFKSFNTSPVRNPCPDYLQGRYSGPNADGSRAMTCFMWEPTVQRAYQAMMRAAGARFDDNPRIEGFVLQESALGFTGQYSQDVGDGGTYTAVAWRDALIDMVQQCASAFSNSRCMAFVNFIRNGPEFIDDVAAAIARVPDNRACLSGPDLLPDEKALYSHNGAIYEVLARHGGCRANSAQNRSYGIRNFNLYDVFRFAVGGTKGDFQQREPRSSGVCVNSYLFWNHRVGESWTGLDWINALPVIAAYPYGREWLDACEGGGGPP
ncbi:MAG TPA: hypothetical protein VNS57_06395 [Steroidobacteraceae bacterium]|nr:hypothetical protein [Steroidobacteraceae bacterium]